jgi:hypothetical protein
VKFDQLIPCPENKSPFKYSAYKYIPKIAGCYILASSSNDILYIGLSMNLYNRFQQHLGSPDKLHITEHGKAVWFYFLPYDASELQRLERTWLNQYEALHGNKPIFNKINSPLA